jgi:predicted nucleotidyltransferase
MERAEILYAVIAGSKLNGFFRPDVDLAHGKDLFIKTAYLLAHNDKTDHSTSD